MRVLVADQHGCDDAIINATDKQKAIVWLFNEYDKWGYYDELKSYIPADPLPEGYEYTKPKDDSIAVEAYYYAQAKQGDAKAAYELLYMRSGCEDEGWYFDEVIEP